MIGRFLTLFLCIPLFFLACDDDEALPQPVNCNTGFVINADNECECPDERVALYDNCVETNENDYYGVTEGCPCVDTLLLSLTPLDENDPNFNLFYLRTNQNLSFGELSDEERSRLTGEVIVFTTDYLEVDSIYGQDFPEFGTCDVTAGDDTVETIRFNGLLSEDGENLSMTFFYLTNADPDEVMDAPSCTVDFSRR